MKDMLKRTLALTGIILLFLSTVAFAVDYNEARRADKFDVSDNEVIKFDFDDEDYDPEEDDWFILGGKWEVEDGCLKQKRNFTGYNDKQMNYYGKTFGDFTAKLRFKVTEVTGATQGWFALAFRRTQYDHEHEESGYIITVEGPLSESNNAVFCDWTKSLAFSEYADRIDVNGFVDMVVVAKGNTYTFYFNDAIDTGEYNFKIVDDSWTEPGFIGLCAGNSLIEVDYLYLYTGDKQEGIIPLAAANTQVGSVRRLDRLTETNNRQAALIGMAISGFALLLSLATLFIGVKKHEK